MWLISFRITPIVRVPANSSEWISRVLDGDAQAVIVPHVNTAAEAAHVVKCAKFAPIGERSATNGMLSCGIRRSLSGRRTWSPMS